MAGGYAKRIGFIDLSNEAVYEERLDEELSRQFIGGYGLGARILSERHTSGIGPLDPENILGFTTGPLTGTKVPTGGRLTVVCKSPLTGGWGDANTGGYFGSELKSAGWDAIFISGACTEPKYLLVSNEKIEIKDAGHLWGKDTIETEETLRSGLETPRLRVASIGPASERLSLISGIVNDKGRISARSGVGAVMGSKKLKAVAVRGTTKVQVYDNDRLTELRKKFVKELRDIEGFPKILMKSGTSGATGLLLAAGATPVKNWLLAGEQAFPNAKSITDIDTILKYQTKKYACANCPIACGGIYSLSHRDYAVQEMHKPEYETIGAFGPLCMNNDLPSIVKMNDLCNRSGLDTISTGGVIAFAMECFEHGILSTTDTDGLELTWGNHQAMVSLVEKIIRREGIGDILADGVKIAAEKIGAGAEHFAMHIGGQEPGLHNALFLPERGTGFVCDPTPGRHTAGPMARLDAGSCTMAPYPEMQFKAFGKDEHEAKGLASARVSSYWQVGACAGVCQFPVVFFGNYPLLDFLQAVTGWDMTMSELLITGQRIQTLRQCYNIREGIDPTTHKLPARLTGHPPKTEGPLAGTSLDIDTLAVNYRKAMGWDPVTARPSSSTLQELGLAAFIDDNAPTYGDS